MKTHDATLFVAGTPHARSTKGMRITSGFFRALVAGLFFTSHLDAQITDCNQNGIPDAVDLADGTSRDCNENHNPDECDVLPINFGFDLASTVDIADATAVSTGDLDGDGDIDVAVALDSTALLVVLTNVGDGTLRHTDTLELSEPAHDLLVVDLAGDDRPEIVATGAAVTLLESNRRGGFTARSVLEEPGAIEVLAEDLDGDGDRDLAVLVGDPLPGVRLVENIGLGEFRATTFQALNAVPTAFTALDLEGDGFLDLAVTIPATSTVHLLVGRGDGTILRTEDWRLERGSRPLHGIAAGEFDDRGGTDLVVSGRGTNAWRLQNEGNGRFTIARIELELASRGSREARVISADLDGDGTDDVALFRNGAEPFLNDGEFNFSARPSPTSAVPRAGDVADLDGDGIFDLVVAEPTRVAVYVNRPVAYEFDCDEDSLPDSCELNDCNCNAIPDSCEVAEGEDCNQNGIPDECDEDCNRNRLPDECEIADGTALDCNRNGIPDECDVELNDCNDNGVPDDCDVANGEPDCNANGSPDNCDVRRRFAFVGRATIPLRAPRHLVSGDLDGDGAEDVIATGLRGTWVIWNDGERTLGEPSQIASTGGPAAIGDWNADGQLDVAVVVSASRCPTRRQSLQVHVQNGPRRFRRHAERWFALGRVDDLQAADVDGDLAADLFVASSEGVFLIRGHGDGSFSTAEWIFPAGCGLAVADFDRDGVPDLAIAAADDDAAGAVLVNDGAGGFQTLQRFPVRGLVGELVPVDLDGDGNTDLASGAGHVLWNDGSGLFEAARIDDTESTSRCFAEVAAGDWNGDGSPDLAWPVAGNLQLYVGDGQRNFIVHSQLPEPRATSSLLAVHVAGSQRLLVASPDDAQVLVLERFSDATLGGRHHPLPEQRGNLSLVNGSAVLDFNRDGSPDLVVPVSSPTEESLHFFENDGHGAFRAAGQTDLSFEPQFLAVGDFDLGGAKEILVAGRTDLQLVGQVAESRFEVIAERFLDSGGHVAAADLDGDRRSEGILASRSGGVRVVDLAGDGTLRLRRLIDTPAGFAVPFDADADGDLDLAVGNRDILTVFTNGGVGRWEFSARHSLPGFGLLAVSGDFDNDGVTDLAVALQVFPLGVDRPFVNGAIAFLSERAGERFQREVVLTEPGQFVSSSLAFGDFDRDGDLDLMAPQTWIWEFDLPLGSPTILRYDNVGDGRFVRREIVAFGSRPVGVVAADLNGSGTADWIVTDNESLSIWLTEPRLAAADDDGNGIPDACGDQHFRRGDVNQDRAVDLADGLALLNGLVAVGPPPACARSADANDDDRVNITDAVFLLNALFLEGRAIPPPHATCGSDGDADALACEVFTGC